MHFNKIQYLYNKHQTTIWINTQYCYIQILENSKMSTLRIRSLLLYALLIICCGLSTNILANTKWVSASQLVSNNVLKTRGGEVVRVLTIKRKNGVRRMYNLTVNQNHDFFVSDWHHGILVHNCTCPYCGKNDLVSEDSLEAHVSEYHGKEAKRPFLCNIGYCKYGGNAQRNLDGHLIRVHETEESICPTCGRKYRNKTLLNAHKRTVHSTQIYVCKQPGCNNRPFKTAYKLQKHRRNIHYGGERQRMLNNLFGDINDISSSDPDFRTFYKG